MNTFRDYTTKKFHKCYRCIISLSDRVALLHKTGCFLHNASGP